MLDLDALSALREAAEIMSGPSGLEDCPIHIYYAALANAAPELITLARRGQEAEDDASP